METVSGRVELTEGRTLKYIYLIELIILSLTWIH